MGNKAFVSKITPEEQLRIIRTTSRHTFQVFRVVSKLIVRILDYVVLSTT